MGFAKNYFGLALIVCCIISNMEIVSALYVFWIVFNSTLVMIIEARICNEDLIEI